MGMNRIRIRNYRGIQAFDVNVGAGGAVVAGRNAIGKTSFLKAVLAALVARDVHEDAIHGDAEKGEITIDFDHYSVRRIIERGSGSRVIVENPDGDRKAKPQTFLNDLFDGAIDPLEFFLAKPKERRAAVLKAMKITLTNEHINRWVPEWAQAEFLTPELRKVLLEVHGLDATSELHRKLYDIRRDANAKVETIDNDIKHEVGKLDELRPGVDPAALTVDAATAGVQAARAVLVELQGQARRYAEQDEKRRAIHDRAVGLRTEAEQVRADAPKKVPTKDEVHEQDKGIAKVITRIMELEAELASVRKNLDEMQAARATMLTTRQTAQLAEQRAEALDKQAAALEETVKAITETPVTDEQIVEATANVMKADQAAEAAARAEEFRQKEAAIAALHESKAVLAKRANDLTEIVDRLSKGAVQELIKESNGIAGIGVDGDAITLDGISIDARSSAEQIRFGCELARRLNPKAKLFIVDALERLDPDALELFKREATRDGWQLLATRVERGELVYEPIEVEKAEAAE